MKVTGTCLDLKSAKKNQALRLGIITDNTTTSLASNIAETPYINPHNSYLNLHLSSLLLSSGLQPLIKMAVSSLSKLLTFSFSLSVLTSLVLAHEFSIVGYSPDDLKSIDRLVDLFESWMAKHGKIYKSFEEKLHRFEVFKDNLEHIDDRNKKIVNYWLGLNEFADLSHEEFKKMHLGLKVELPKSRGSPEEFTYRDVVDLPNSVDWRKKGAVTPVKNQGSCGKYIQRQCNAVYLITSSMDYITTSTVGQMLHAQKNNP